MFCDYFRPHKSQRTPPGYIIENVPVVSTSRARTLESMHRIHQTLGLPILFDAAAVGSRAHRPRLWWTNMAPPELLQSAVGRIQRPDTYVRDILDPHRAPRRVYHDDQAPLAVVNRKGEPRRALPTLVSYARSYAFKDNGPGLVWDSLAQEMVEPNADERERAMGFPTGTTHIPGISESQRRFLLGQAMDLNCLTWLVSLVAAEQKRLASSLTGYMGYYEMRSAIEPFTPLHRGGQMVGGGRASASHPWDVWSYGTLFAKTGGEVLNHGSHANELAHPRMELEEHVEKIFMEEHTAKYMEEIDKVCRLEGFGGLLEMEEEEPPPVGIQ